jgi:hypothetical protein
MARSRARASARFASPHVCAGRGSARVREIAPPAGRRSGRRDNGTEDNHCFYPQDGNRTCQVRQLYL